MRLLLIFIIFFFGLSTSAFAHSDTVIIKMTPNGFEPQTRTVDENSVVLFVNQDKVDHWPASNIHPTHDIYPEFDPQKAINPGSSWSFKPKKVGEWKFHDHLLPHIRGTITVESEEGEAKRVPTLFTAIKSFFINFYENFKAALNKGQEINQLVAADFKKLDALKQMDLLKNMITSKGAKDTWEYFKNSFAGEAGSSGNIHDLAHFLGKLTFE